jgi:hypothetical protein
MTIRRAPTPGNSAGREDSNPTGFDIGELNRNERSSNGPIRGGLMAMAALALGLLILVSVTGAFHPRTIVDPVFYLFLLVLVSVLLVSVRLSTRRFGPPLVRIALSEGTITFTLLSGDLLSFAWTDRRLRLTLIDNFTEWSSTGRTDWHHEYAIIDPRGAFAKIPPQLFDLLLRRGDELGLQTRVKVREVGRDRVRYIQLRAPIDADAHVLPG